MSLASAQQFLGSVRELQRRADVNPLQWVRWTPPQQALLECTDRRVLLRTGNQFGKTWAALAEAIFWATGYHPFKRLPFAPPVEILLITTSWSQSVAIQQKLWHLLPKEAVTEDTVFDSVRGFRGGITPVVEFRNGSKIRIKTSRQGGLSLAGSTVHLVIGDEPFKTPRIYAEVERRLTRTGGHLILSLTPVNADCTWLRELVEEGKITDLHFDMSPDNFVPVGTDKPLATEDGQVMDEGWIEEQRQSVLSWEAPVVLDGEWEFRATGRVFENFKPSVHVVRNLLRSNVAPPGEVELLLGIDYGDDALRTVAVLLAVDDSGENTKVYQLAEYVPDAASTLDMDAQGIMQMLAGMGIRWHELDHAYGDKRYTDARGRLTIKSNGRMLEAIERQLKTGRGARPKIKSAKRGAGQKGRVWAGVRWLNEAQIRPGHFFIDESCAWTIECFNRWDGREKDKHKDAIDAFRYALTPFVFRRMKGTSKRVVLY